VQINAPISPIVHSKEVRERKSDLLWAGFLLLTLRHDSGAKPGAEVVRKFVKLGIAVDFDGFLGCIADHIAVMAPSQVIFKFRLGTGVNDPIQVIG
jgi:hypothetical protein